MPQKEEYKDARRYLQYQFPLTLLVRKTQDGLDHGWKVVICNHSENTTTCVEHPSWNFPPLVLALFGVRNVDSSVCLLYCIASMAQETESKAGQ